MKNGLIAVVNTSSSMRDDKYIEKFWIFRNQKN